ncbi:MAG: pyridoxal 5'-phosphate synthase glutaminase subunit PdxT [Firmicutes bacterium HGW-Firmicutes-1]|nr:MAG: pyridoxal 5'-phosphate synthase glutaminase subunit PdxT [Firmicutes bacterium HGW-Firmicutes-1]
MKIGILALQGSVIEHIQMFHEISGVEAFPLKYEEELEQVDGIVIPGGESTTIRKLLIDFHLLEPLQERIKNGLPVWGTCAGLIILAKTVDGLKNPSIGTMDICAHRNAYGRQKDSFIVEAMIPQISEGPVPLIFIRAPYISEVGPHVEILKIVHNHIVAAREKNMLVTAFHPELTQNLSTHKYFLSMINNK